MILKSIETPESILEVSQLARQIWEEHFTPILGKAQVEYMLQRYQSPEAITKAIEKEGYRYYFILTPQKEIAGYCGLLRQSPTLFLSKLYIQKAFRGQGLAVKVIETLCSLAQKEGLSTIRLHCNRFNKNTLDIYNHLGFQILSAKKGDIGGGFFTDDYILEKTLTTPKLINKPIGN